MLCGDVAGLLCAVGISPDCRVLYGYRQIVVCCGDIARLLCAVGISPDCRVL